MAACGSLQHIFEKSLPPENPTLLESLSSWNKIKPVIDDHSSFTEIFGELHFKEKSESNLTRIEDGIDDDILTPKNNPSLGYFSSKNPIDDHLSFTEIFGELHFKENLGSILPPAQIRAGDRIDDNDGPSNLTPTMSPSSDYFSTTSMDNHSSFTEVFRGLNFKENTDSFLFSLSRTDDRIGDTNSKLTIPDYLPTTSTRQYHKNNDSFSSMNSESLQLCTEGLGFESFDNVEDLKMMEIEGDRKNQQEKTRVSSTIHDENICRRSKTSRFVYPPPISCIGNSGKPWVSFKSYRENGRFVLKEVRIPTQEFLHASREDGRLKLQLVHSEDENIEEGDEDEETDDYCEELDEIEE